MVLFDRSVQVKIDSRAPSSNSLYILPYAATPPARPLYRGPVVMQIPDAQLTNVRMDGTIAGGGGLVDTLDFVWTEKGQYALRAGTFVSLFGGANVIPGAVQPQSIASSVRFGTLSTSAGASPTYPTGPGYTDYTTIFSAGMTFKQVLQAVPSGNILTLPAGTYNVGSDFADNSGTSGCAIPANVGGIWGAGRTTILQLTPGSSSKAGYVAGLVTNDTNELHVMDANHSNFLLKNVQCKGTNQGHNYNWLRVGNGDIHYQTGCTIDGVYFNNANPGDQNGPPGETFAIDANWCDGLQILNCEMDGRDPSSGVPTSASPLGFNNCINSYVQDTYLHHAKTSMPTWWRCKNIHTLRLRSEFNGTGAGLLTGAGINHEQCDGTILHESVTLKPNYTGGGNHGLHFSFLNDDGTHTAATQITISGVTNDGGPDGSGIVGGYNYNNQPITIIKNGVTLTQRAGGSGGDPNANWYLYS